jgi:beta-galactosidase
LVLALCVNAQQTPWPDPAFPFGAVYFRKSNPPERDWERDHKTAAQLGVNVFRHWFMWASIENSPGHYDWRDYDRMVELEAQNHIKVVIAEIVSAGAPEWMWDKYPQARHIASDGSQGYPAVNTGSATGSAPMCLDNEDVRAQAEKFLTARWSAIATIPPRWATTCGTKAGCSNAIVPPLKPSSASG